LKSFFQKLKEEFGEDVKVNLKMNSLEDAFVNIGMDEEKFLKKAKMSQASKFKESQHEHEDVSEEKEE
jgi:ATP-binding cassette subfamily A (ABC1) protein 3